jgi:hypothetical protein
MIIQAKKLDDGTIERKGERRKEWLVHIQI